MTVTAATTIHYVADIARALSFYKEALQLTANSESRGWSTLRLADSCELALHSREPRDAGTHPFDTLETSLSLSVDNLDKCVVLIKQHGGEHLRTLEPRDGIPVRIALVRDTEGVGFQISQYVG